MVSGDLGMASQTGCYDNNTEGAGARAPLFTVCPQTSGVSHGIQRAFCSSLRRGCPLILSLSNRPLQRSYYHCRSQRDIYCSDKTPPPPPLLEIGTFPYKQEVLTMGLPVYGVLFHYCAFISSLCIVAISMWNVSPYRGRDKVLWLKIYWINVH